MSSKPILVEFPILQISALSVGRYSRCLCLSHYSCAKAYFDMVGLRQSSHEFGLCRKRQWSLIVRKQPDSRLAANSFTWLLGAYSLKPEEVSVQWRARKPERSNCVQYRFSHGGTLETQEWCIKTVLMPVGGCKKEVVHHFGDFVFLFESNERSNNVNLLNCRDQGKCTSFLEARMVVVSGIEQGI